MTKIEIIGAAYGLGGPTPGPSDGPRAVRECGLISRLKQSGIEVAPGEDLSITKIGPEVGDPKLRYLDAAVEFSARLADRVRQSMGDGAMPLVIGGDHAISIGAVSGVASFLREQSKDTRLGLLWVDAHADLNTPDTTPSGNIHGMSVAVLLGHGDPRLCAIGGEFPKVAEQHLAYLGLRSLDPAERDWIKGKDLTAYTMKNIDLRGIGPVASEVIGQLSESVDALYVSFDLDVCDPHAAPGVGTPERGGLTIREAHLILELLAETGKVVAYDFVELNPIADREHKTTDLTIRLIESALGKTTL